MKQGSLEIVFEECDSKSGRLHLFAVFDGSEEEMLIFPKVVLSEALFQTKHRCIK